MKTIVQLVEKQKEYILEKDKAAKQAVEANIAPVEADPSSASRAYVVGEQLFLNDVLYDVTSPISVGDAIVVNTNITAANKLSADIQSKQDQIEVTTMPTASASNVGKVLIYIGATTSTYTSGQSYQSTLEGGNYIWKPTSISSVDASDVVYDNQTSGLTATDSQAAIDELASQNQTLTNYVNNGIYYDGAKNLLPLLISKIKAINTTGSWSKSDENDVYTISGVTYTITSNANGVITNIKASGTGASSIPFSDLYITLRNTYDAFAIYELIKNNTLTVATHAVNSVNFILDGQYNDSWKTVQAISGKADITLNISTSNNVQTCIRIVAGRTVTNEDITPIMAQKSLMDIDDSFSPYAKTNLQLTQDSVTWDNLSEVGAVNQLLIKTSGDTTLSNGVYGTYNSDNTITLHGTATSNLVISVEEYKTFKAGTYKLSGAPSMGSSDLLVSLTMRTSSNTIYGGARNDTDGVVFTLPTDTALKLVIYVKYGTNVEGKVVKPMLTPVSYNGPYVPPAKTNRELTDLHSIHSNSYTIHQDWNVSTVQDPLAKRLGITASMTLEQMIKQFQGGDDNSWGLNIKISTNYSAPTANSVQWIKDIYNIFNTNGIALIDITLCATGNGMAFISFTTSEFNSLKFVMLDNWTAGTVKSISFDT